MTSQVDETAPGARLLWLFARPTASAYRGVLTKRGALYVHNPHPDTWARSQFTAAEVAWFQANPKNHVLRIQQR